jgi:hypothetical protein
MAIFLVLEKNQKGSSLELPSSQLVERPVAQALCLERPVAQALCLNGGKEAKTIRADLNHQRL